MATNSFEYAVEIVLRQEGSKIYANTRTGEYSRFGITLKFLQSILPSATRDDVTGMTAAQATLLYEKYFWRDIHLDAIRDWPLAAAVLSFTVNMWTGGITRDLNLHDGSITLLQKTCNHLLPSGARQLLVDGKFGPESQAVVNALVANDVLKLYCQYVTLQYNKIALDPVYAPNLKGWLKRVGDFQALVVSS